MKPRIALFDDNEHDLLDYREALYNNFSGVIVSTFQNEKDLLQEYANEPHPFDILLADISIGNRDMHGFHVACEVKALDDAVKILYLTTHREAAFIRKAINHAGAIGYIEKAFDKTPFIQEMQDILRLLDSENADVFIAQAKSGALSLPMKDITYFSSDRRQKLIHTTFGKQPFSCYLTIDEILHQVKCPPFTRINKSQLVNLRHVLRFDQKAGELLMKSGEHLFTTRLFTKSVQRDYMNFIARCVK